MPCCMQADRKPPTFAHQVFPRSMTQQEVLCTVMIQKKSMLTVRHTVTPAASTQSPIVWAVPRGMLMLAAVHQQLLSNASGGYH